MHVAHLLQDRTGGMLNCWKTSVITPAAFPLLPALITYPQQQGYHTMCVTQLTALCAWHPTQEVGWQANGCKDWFLTCSPINVYLLRCSYYYLASKVVKTGQQCNPHQSKHWPYLAMGKPSCILWVIPVVLKTAVAYQCSLISPVMNSSGWLFYFIVCQYPLSCLPWDHKPLHSEKAILFNVFVATFGSRNFSHHYPWVTSQTVLTPTQNIDYLPRVYSFLLLILLALIELIILTDPRKLFPTTSTYLSQ